eukprot:836464-Pyramimonas_sp.AAC.1
MLTRTQTHTYSDALVLISEQAVGMFRPMRWSQHSQWAVGRSQADCLFGGLGIGASRADREDASSEALVSAPRRGGRQGVFTGLVVP